MNKLCLCLVLAMTLGLTACGATAPTAAPTAAPVVPSNTMAKPTDVPPTAAQGFPTGKFVSDKGKAFWQFRPDGTWDFYSDSGLPLEGNYTTTSSTYTETFDNASSLVIPDQANCARPATYTWTFDGSRLSFQTLDDKCAVRIDWYTSSSFVLAK